MEPSGVFKSVFLFSKHRGPVCQALFRAIEQNIPGHFSHKCTGVSETDNHHSDEYIIVNYGKCNEGKGWGGARQRNQDFSFSLRTPLGKEK